MTTSRTTPGAAPVPRNASALVVGLEKYDDIPGAGTDLPGSARLAARFALWLLERRICLPDRITLMTAYDEAAYRDGVHEKELSPEGKLDELKSYAGGTGPGVNLVPDARAEEDFEAWILGGHGPQPQDHLFLLFWVGHAFTYPDRRDDRLCLLGTDASAYQLKHIELTNLLDTVTDIAPGVHEVAFLNTCRAPVQGQWEKRLEEGFRAVSRPASPRSGERPGRPAPRSQAAQSIAYAAAEGQTTKMAGWHEQSFADVLLGRLEDPSSDGNPQAVFGDFLKGIGDQLRWGDGFRPHVTTFGYFHDYEKRLDKPPPTDEDLSHEEWTRLTEIAQAIDASASTRKFSYANLYWNAYYHAVELWQVLGVDNDIPDRPERLDSLEDLIEELRDRPCQQRTYPPPLVIACDFVAYLPRRSPARRDLAAWCQKWAHDRVRRGGRRRLDLAEKRRPKRLYSGEYLSISVDDKPNLRLDIPAKRDISDKQYWLRGFLWATGGPALLPSDRWVTKNEIAAAAVKMIGEAERLQYIGDLPGLLVEFVLPRDLLGRRLEYEGNPALGLNPVVFRNLERLRSSSMALARSRAQKTQDLIDQHRPRKSPWSTLIKWIPCRPAAALRKTRFPPSSAPATRSPWPSGTGTGTSRAASPDSRPLRSCSTLSTPARPSWCRCIRKTTADAVLSRLRIPAAILPA